MDTNAKVRPSDERKNPSVLKTDSLFEAYAMPIIQTEQFRRTEAYIQHGSTTCFVHSVAVAYCSCLIAYRLGFQCDMQSLIIGALLHDYFLYDWHEKDSSHRLHGFFHPQKALENALRDFTLNPVEEDAILRHMFPLTPFPPKYRESMIVCIADKLCSLMELFGASANKSAYNPQFRNL